MDSVRPLFVLGTEMQSNYDSLMRCILENPFEDGPRLVMTDLMEEMGDANRAEFVRTQVRLFGMKRARQCPKCEGSGKMSNGPTVYDEEDCNKCKGRGFVGGNWESWELVKREMELLESWVSGREGSNCKWWIGGTSYATPKALEGWHGGWWPKPNSVASKSVSVRFERGMVAKIGLRIETLLAHAGEIFEKWPVVEVEVFDRKPNRGIWHVTGFSWLPMDGDDSPENGWLGSLEGMTRWTPVEPPHVLPWRIFDLAEGLRTKNVSENDDDCRLWVSRACVKYGRERAGLSVLKWPSPA